MRRATAYATVASVIFAIAWLAIPRPAIPAFEEVRARWRPSDAQLLDRNGEPIHEVRIDRHGRRLAWVALDDISPALIQVVIASEDRRFPRHCGVDFVALAGSIRSRLAGRRARGASTITMQLAALIDPALTTAGRRRSAWQKLIQMKTALAIERRWSKRQILEAYLNLVTYRGELQGVGAAARVMFGKQPHGIAAGEAVVLAALLRAPNARRAALARRAESIRLAMAADAPGRGEVADAVARATSRRGSDFSRVTLAPGLAERWLRGINPSLRTTLDRGLQAFATRALRSQILEVRDRHVQDGAVLVVENATGEVWAYVAGSGDLSSAPYVDGVRAPRQPGSTLKPFLYALAIERRLLTPASLLLDTPLELPEERGLYRPLDYDRQFRGLVSMRTALASSLNVPAVRTADLVGVEALAEHLRRLGLEIVEQGDYYGASLALGSADVSLWNLVNGYRTLANGGVLTPLRLFARHDTRPPGVVSGPAAMKTRGEDSSAADRTHTLTLSPSASSGQVLVRKREPGILMPDSVVGDISSSPLPRSVVGESFSSPLPHLVVGEGQGEGSGTLQQQPPASAPPRDRMERWHHDRRLRWQYARHAHLLACDRLPDLRYPRRPRQPQRHLRPREQSRHALLERGQDRDQQGHAR